MASDSSTGKGRLLAVALIWLTVLGAGVSIWVYWWKPRVEHVKREEILQTTSAKPRYKHSVTLNLDSFSGYCGFRHVDFSSECRKHGIRIKTVDDGANYTRRLQSLADGTSDMAVFTVDALIKASALQGDIPGTIVSIIDETKGADAIIGPRKKFPNIDSLNDPELRFVCVPDSPSETLARVIMAYFNLDQLSKSPFQYVDSADLVYQAYQRSKPTDKKVFVLWEPYVSRLAANPDYHVLVDSSKFRGYIVDVLVARRGFLHKNKDLVLRILKSYQKTIFENRNRMTKLILEDARTLGEPLKTELADNLIAGIWWKNTQENYAHFGLTSGHSMQHIGEICANVTDVLVRTHAISRDPTDGQPNQLYYDGILRQMHETHWHPGIGHEGVRTEKALIALSDQEWKTLRPVGTLQIPRLVFARGTSQLRGHSMATLDRLAENLTTWPQYYLKVIGSTTSRGNLQANQKLALDRAESAIKYLMKKNVNKNRTHAEIDTTGRSTTVTFVLGELPY